MDNTMTTTKPKWEGKQLYWRFKRLIYNISHRKTWTWLRKGKFKREKESLPIAVKNNAVRTNHIKAKIDKTQQNSKNMLCDDRDKTINHITSECSKLVQEKSKTRHDWVGKVIHGEMCKKFKVDHTNKSYMYNPAPVLENDTLDVVWRVETTQTTALLRTARILLRVLEIWEDLLSLNLQWKTIS